MPSNEFLSKHWIKLHITVAGVLLSVLSGVFFYTWNVSKNYSEMKSDISQNQIDISKLETKTNNSDANILIIKNDVGEIRGKVAAIYDMFFLSKKTAEK